MGVIGEISSHSQGNVTETTVPSQTSLPSLTPPPETPTVGVTLTPSPFPTPGPALETPFGPAGRYLIHLVIEGDKAFLVTKFAMRITSPDGKTKDTSGRTFLVYRKGADGMWRVWRDMDNYAPDVQLKIGD